MPSIINHRLSPISGLGRQAGAFRKDERGFALALGLIWIVILLAFGGVAIDTANAWRMRAMLQVTADASVHAGVMQLPPPGYPATPEDVTAIKAEAVRLARLHMDPSIYGDVVTVDNIQIGRWDSDNNVFIEDTQYPNAVRVKAIMSRATGNPVLTTLLKFVGLDSWDVGATSMIQRFLPRCTSDGIISAQVAGITSNNFVEAPFCLHGETGVSMKNGNILEDGTIVSMPDFAMLELPTAGYGSNPGLEGALSEEYLYPRMIKKIDTLYEELQDIKSWYQPGYIKNGNGHLEEKTDTEFEPLTLGTDSTKGNVYIVRCKNDNQLLTIGPNMHLWKNVVVTNCQVKITESARIWDTVIITSNTGGTSITAPASVTIGQPDDCNPTQGGAALITKGGISLSSGNHYHDAQLVAKGDVKVAAASEGVKGIRIQAGGDGILTADGGFSLCDERQPASFVANYYRFVQ